MNDLIARLLDVVQDVDPLLRTLLAGAAMLLETSILIGLVVPGDTIVIVAGTAVASPSEAVGLAVAVVAGSVVGESLGYLIGRALGPHLRRSRLGRWIGAERWNRADQLLNRWGGWAVFLSRFIPVLHSIVPLTAGAGHFGYGRFLAWTVPASAIWAAGYIGVAATAAGSFRRLAEHAEYGGVTFVGVIVAFLLVVFVVRAALRKAEARANR